jgi:hypothetical protein
MLSYEQLHSLQIEMDVKLMWIGKEKRVEEAIVELPRISSW